MSSRVYVASSWRNPIQPVVVRALRDDGHDVYDFRNPAPGDTGFAWRELDASLPVGPADLELSAASIRRMLGHPAAAAGFARDMDALESCEACALILPCGRSAHLEAGWAAGAGKRTAVLLSHGEPELMWKMLGTLCTTIGELSEALR